MFYAGQDRATMAYANALEGLCGDRLTLHESARDGLPDLVGLLSGQPPETVVYVCGPGASRPPPTAAYTRHSSSDWRSN